MARAKTRVLRVVGLLALVACGGVPPLPEARQQAQRKGAATPAHLATRAEMAQSPWLLRPAAAASSVVLRAEPGGRAIGYASAGVPAAHLASSSRKEGGKTVTWHEVLLLDALRVRAWVREGQFGVRLTQPGPLSPLPLWAERSDVLPLTRLPKSGVQAVPLDVALQLPLYNALDTTPVAYATARYELSVPLQQLAAARTPAAPRETPVERCFWLPADTALRRRPAEDAPTLALNYPEGASRLRHHARLMRARAPWYAVLLGRSPALAVFVQAPQTQPAPCVLKAKPPATARVPARLRLDTGVPLFRVPAGEVLMVGDVAVALVKRPVWVRRLALLGTSEADVYAASERVALRARLPMAALRIVDDSASDEDVQPSAARSATPAQRDQVAPLQSAEQGAERNEAQSATDQSAEHTD